jgi:hypothetical protein
MKPKGHLTVDYRPEAGHMEWRWRSSLVPIETAWKKSLSQAEYKCALDRFYSDWDHVLDALSHSNLANAREILQKARCCLTAAIVPDDIDWDVLGTRGTPITVTASPDEIPIENVIIRNMPFVVYYPSMHTKLRSPSRIYSRPSARHLDYIVQPCAHFSVMDNVLDSSSNSAHQHCADIRNCLLTLYGEGHVDNIGNGIRQESYNINCDLMIDLLCNTNMSCLYHFGHGLNGDQAGLSLADGNLYTRDLITYVSPEHHRFKGFAFINSCWSASSSASGSRDVVRVLLESGWLSAIGTVLKPLDVQAADFAYRFFLALPRKGCRLLDAYYSAVVDSWNRYSTNSEVCDLTWGCYRLYCLSDFGTMQSRVTEPDGCVIFRTQDAVLDVWKPTWSGQYSLPDDQIKEYLEKCQESEESVFDYLLQNPRWTQLSEVLLGTALEKFPQDIWRFIPNPMRTVLQIAYERGRINHGEVGREELGKALAVYFLDEKNRIDNVQSIAWPIRIKIDARALIRDFMVQARKGEVLSFERFSSLGVLSLASMERGADPARDTVQLAWQMARRSGANVLGVIHLFKAVLVQAIRDGLIHGGGTPFYVEQTSFRYLDGIDTSESQELLTIPDRVSEDAERQLIAARYSWSPVSNRPFWYHLLVILFRSDWSPLIVQLDTAGWDSKVILDELEKMLQVQDARCAMRAVARAGGIPVGSLWNKLPSAALRVWGDAMKRAATTFKEHAILLVVPWLPCPDALCDAIASHLLILISETGLECAKRHWMHLQAEKLIEYTKPHWLFGLLRSKGANADLDEIQHEVRDRGVLVLSEVTDWNNRQEFTDPARRVLRLVEQQILRSVLFISQRDWNSHKGQAWKKTRLIPIELTPLKSNALREFVREWELHRHAMVDEDALDCLLKTVKRSDKYMRLQHAWEIWRLAESNANGASPTKTDVTFAIKCFKDSHKVKLQ